jgi:hypothetical protein
MPMNEDADKFNYTQAQCEVAEAVLKLLVDTTRSPVEAMAVLVLVHAGIWRLCMGGHSTTEMLELYLKDFFSLINAEPKDTPPDHAVRH